MKAGESQALTAIVVAALFTAIVGCGNGELLTQTTPERTQDAESRDAAVEAPRDAAVEAPRDAAVEAPREAAEAGIDQAQGTRDVQGPDVAGPDGGDAEASAPDAACPVTCGAKECGGNGCGGSCGTCGSYEDCTNDGWCEAPATPQAAPPIRISTYNACGAKCTYSGVSVSTWVASLTDDISSWSADAVLFTELCYGQLNALRSSLGAGWGYVWWTAYSNNSGCSKWGTDLRFGMAILAKHAAGGALPNRQTATLPKSKDCSDVNKRGLLCAKPLIDGESTLTCVTHFSHKATCSTSRGLQAQQVADLTLSWSGGGASIVGGDLNAKPADPVLDSLYALDGTGRYLEADQEQAKWWPSGCTGACRSGEPTYPTVDPTSKIDYILFSAAHFGAVTGDVVYSDGSMSDHRLLRGAAARK